MNLYAILADLVVFIHLVYMAIIVLGQLAILIGWPLGWRWIRNPWFRGIHLVMILIIAFEWLMGWDCPLTLWEHDLRRAAGQMVGDELLEIGFIGQMLRNIAFAGDNWVEHVNTSIQVTAAIIVATLILVPPRFRKVQSELPETPATQGA